MVIKNSRPPGTAQTAPGAVGLDTTGAEKPRQQSQRSASENKERAYIAASRRSDRSIDARVQSARMASVIHKDRTGKSLRITEDIVLKEEMYEEEDDMPSHARRYWKDSDLPAKFRDFATVQAAMHLSVTNPAILHSDASRVEEEFERVFGSKFRSPSQAAFAIPYSMSQNPRSPHPLQVDTQLAQQGGSAPSPSAMSPCVSSATIGSPGFPFGAVQPHISSPLNTPNAAYPQLSPRILGSRAHSVASDMGSTPLSRSSTCSLGSAQQGRRRSRDEFAGSGSTHQTPVPSTGGAPTAGPPSKRRRSDFAALDSTTTPTRDLFTSQLPQNVQDMFASTWMNNTQWQHKESVWDSVELQQESLALQNPPPPKNHGQKLVMSHAPITAIHLACSDRSRSSSLAPSTNYSLSNQSISPTAPGADMAYTMFTTEAPHTTLTTPENLSLSEIANSDFTYWDPSASATDFSGDFNIEEFLNMSQSQDADNNNATQTWFA